MINLILLGGLSESGKSHASRFSEQHGFKHMRIIYFEEKIMPSFEIDPNSNEQNPFTLLYNQDHNLVFKKFWEEIKLFCENNKVKNIALDSTTRVDMVDFFLKTKDVNFLSLYFEADFTKRVKREFIKKGTLPIEKIRTNTENKDFIKLERKADQVKTKSLIVSNNGTLLELQKKLIEVFDVVKNNTFKQQENILLTDKKETIKYIDDPEMLANSADESKIPKDSDFISPHFVKMK